MRGAHFPLNNDPKKRPRAPRTRDILTLLRKSSVFTQDVLNKQLEGKTKLLGASSDHFLCDKYQKVDVFARVTREQCEREDAIWGGCLERKACVFLKVLNVSGFGPMGVLDLV